MLNMWVIRREIDVHSPRGDEEQVENRPRCHVGLFTAICLLFASVLQSFACIIAVGSEQAPNLLPKAGLFCAAK